MSRIDAILFDADGVIQRPSTHFREELAKLVSYTNCVDELISDIFMAEKTCLTGEGKFKEELKKILDKWGSKSSVEKALKIWSSIEADKDILELIQYKKDHKQSY